MRSRVLKGFDWPGNVRQLVNACRRLTVTAAGPEIQAADIPAELGGKGQRLSGTPRVVGQPDALGRTPARQRRSCATAERGLA
jgi:DNA-binding NtrC family response regulator